MRSFIESVKRFLTYMAFGALVGVALCAWLAPDLLEWWAAPVVPGRPYSCEAEIHWGAMLLVKAQVAGAIGFGLLFAVAGALISRALRMRAARKAAATTTSVAPHS